MNREIFTLLKVVNGILASGNLIYLLIMLIINRKMTIESFYHQHSTAFFILSVTIVLVIEFFAPYQKKHFDK